jgi:hypothetical protein
MDRTDKAQSFSVIASYVHLTTCDLFFQTHVIFKSRQVHFQSQLLKMPPPSSLPHKSDASVIPVCAQTCHVCFMDGLHTIRHLDNAACSIFMLTFHPPISLQSPVTVCACAKYQDYCRCNMNVDRLCKESKNNSSVHTQRCWWSDGRCSPYTPHRWSVLPTTHFTHPTWLMHFYRSRTQDTTILKCHRTHIKTLTLILILIFILPSLQHHVPHTRTNVASGSWWWA